MLHYYQQVNDGRSHGFVYSLGDRGFFAEITTVARAMIYAWKHELRMLLDSRDFSYRYRDGWNDYFEPFCPEPWDVSATTIGEWMRFTRTGDRRPFQRFLAFQPETLHFGTLELRGFQNIMRHFMRLLFRLRAECQVEIDRLRRPLSLPSDYVAIHVRRGDKVGDEDVFHPACRYLDALDPIGDSPIFVMTDDYQAVVDVREELEARGLANRVVSLCREEHTGFDVWALREGKTFAGGDQVLETETARRRYVLEETTRLLAETVISKGAQQFVSTFRSNVGKSVWFLHDEPDRCVLLGDATREPPQSLAPPSGVG